MAALLEARMALQHVLSGVPDFPVFHYVTDSAPPPAAWITPEDIDYQQTFGSDHAEFPLVLTILTGRVNEAEAQDQLDRYVSPDGGESIPALINQDNTLGSVVDYCVPVTMERYGTFAMAGVDYIGAQIIFEVRL